jgi:hypothetical protein
MQRADAFLAVRRCNPLLPPLISRRIAADLSREFASQAAAEKAAGMPITVMLGADEVAKAKLEVRAQLWFGVASC